MQLVRLDWGLGVQANSRTIPIRYVIAIGRNYAEHAKEQAAEVPTRPMVFTKSPASLSLDGDDIVVPRVCQDREQVDFEAELAVLIGTPARDVPRERALDHVLAYACANDVSARWWQKEGSGGQFCRGKSFDTFCPLGPRLVPARDISDPQSLRVSCRVNGTTMQSDSTSNMLFPVDVLISDLSRGATLPEGTLLLTGTPSGVGMARKPPAYLRHADVVEVEIDRIGTLRNRVRFEH